MDGEDRRGAPSASGAGGPGAIDAGRPSASDAGTPTLPENARARAEQLLAAAGSTPATHADLEHLAHELAVHQVEIELQNEELRSAMIRTERSRDALLAMFTSAPIPYVMLDPQGHVIMANRMARDWVRQSLFVTNLERREDVGPFLRHLRQVMGGESPAPLELMLNREGAAAAPVCIHATRVQDDAGEERVMLAIVDVTDSRRREQMLRRQREAAERANEAKSAFLARVSHDLRTPLTTVIGYAGMLQRSDLPEAARKKIAAMDRSARHLKDIIHDLLDVTRFELGTASLEATAFSPETLLGDCLSVLGTDIENQGVEFDCELDLPSGLELMGDPRRIRQIAINLIDNAVKFSPRGGRVSVSLAYRERTLILKVSDEGEGIPEELVAQAFVPFSRLDPPMGSALPRRGFGLGLSIVHQFTTLMRGRVFLDRRKPRGTEVIVHIPAQVVESVPVVPKPVPKMARVLVAEDDPEIQTLVCNLLEDEGYEVLAASNGVEALELLERESIEIMVLDLHMPRVDGFQVLQALEIPLAESPPRVVVVTATAVSEELRRKFQRRGYDLLLKPFDAGDLSDAVRTQVRLRLSEGLGSVHA